MYSGELPRGWGPWGPTRPRSPLAFNTVDKPNGYPDRSNHTREGEGGSGNNASNLIKFPHESREDFSFSCSRPPPPSSLSDVLHTFHRALTLEPASSPDFTVSPSTRSRIGPVGRDQVVRVRPFISTRGGDSFPRFGRSRVPNPILEGAEKLFAASSRWRPTSPRKSPSGAALLNMIGGSLAGCPPADAGVLKIPLCPPLPGTDGSIGV